MKRVAGLICCLVLTGGPAWSAEAKVQTVDSRLTPWQAYIDEAAARFDVPRPWIERVILAESAGQAFQNGHPITSKAGAMGLMQLMPGTYDDLRRQYNLGPDPYDPHDNILAGTAYLRAMFDRFGYPGLFAAYNAGPTRFEASFHGLRLPGETRDYLLKVTSHTFAAPIIAPIFVEISTPEAPASSAIFVARSPENAAQLMPIDTDARSKSTETP